jgi:hypothetical protein
MRFVGRAGAAAKRARGAALPRPSPHTRPRTHRLGGVSPGAAAVAAAPSGHREAAQGPPACADRRVAPRRRRRRLSSSRQAQRGSRRHGRQEQEGEGTFGQVLPLGQGARVRGPLEGHAEAHAQGAPLLYACDACAVTHAVASPGSATFPPPPSAPLRAPPPTATARVLPSSSSSSTASTTCWADAARCWTCAPRQEDGCRRGQGTRGGGGFHVTVQTRGLGYHGPLH